MTRATLALLVFAAAPAAISDAQQIGQNAPAAGNGTATFTTSSQLVIETVNVKDKSGKFVEGLTAKDFTVTEDGTEQAIKFFDFQKVPEGSEPAPVMTTLSAPLKKLPEAQISTEKPGDLKYQNRRLLAMYFDMSAMPPLDQLRAVTAAQKFIRTQMTPAPRRRSWFRGCCSSARDRR